ncbi:hypothetical protein SERLA73DRAFT_124366 [Serpula lacrymans var. lacrymans S7.3]|uniref:Uncharacterized protein n=2 Tax=Serpula lacrymans var. lacrymans TaxID=341189 RepID=F8Q4M5_SERL3|nr:uncharacterized protein SERLADRAFT_373272 [Serpula lacrymans var. lacrymans S7.9]EGN96502.1 hypothetical protein SERLA73DRAFT_124366 [Serpula lacrymans var. lacrymans S7.3]EGO20493.1 hypothetical protein SERLADRAFT_373272 [Serpula lacrymans var. lacrymans S7.9]
MMVRRTREADADLPENPDHPSLLPSFESALTAVSRKRPRLSDPLVGHGRHFCRTVHPFCNINSLLINGLLRMSDESDDQHLTGNELREQKIFLSLLCMVPGLKDRLTDKDSSEEEIEIISQLIQKGVSGARSDDTKSIKGAIVEWITPQGQQLSPQLHRNIKSNRGFNHHRTGQLLCPTGLDWEDEETRAKLRNGDIHIAGDHWPIFLYADCIYNAEDPWMGLFKNNVLISAYKYVFTSPSSVDTNAESRATRSGNARLHGMLHVTPASVAYIATQVRFALSSQAIFSRTDITSDSEGFFNSVMDLFEDPDEIEDVNSLLAWWDSKIFPASATPTRIPAKNGALAKIRQRRAALKHQMSPSSSRSEGQANADN